MTRAEVLKILGKPARVEDTVKSKYGETIEVWRYDLATIPAIPIPPLPILYSGNCYLLYFVDDRLRPWKKIGFWHADDDCRDWAGEAARLENTRFGPGTKVDSNGKIISAAVPSKELADLVVVSITIPRSVRRNRIFRGTAIIRNAGMGPIEEEVSVQCWIATDEFDFLESCGPVPLKSQEAGSVRLGAGESAQVTFLGDIHNEGTYYIIIEADPDNLIQEKSEKNNTKTSPPIKVLKHSK